MRLLNITYDTIDDIDLVSVPNEIFDDIDRNIQEFFDWTATENSECWIETNGKRFLCVGTKDFIRWLNKFKHYEIEDAKIISQLTEIDPNYPIAQF